MLVATRTMIQPAILKSRAQKEDVRNINIEIQMHDKKLNYDSITMMQGFPHFEKSNTCKIQLSFRI